MATVGDHLARERERLQAGGRAHAGPPVLIEAASVREVVLPAASVNERGGETSGQWRTQRVNLKEFAEETRERVERMLALQDLVGDESAVVPVVKSGQNPSPHVCVGRAKRNDILIADPTVSSVHAVFEGEGEHLVLLDQNSSNGTFINARRVEPGERVTVTSGDCLRFGGRVFYYLSGERLLLFLELRVVRRPASAPASPPTSR